MSFDLVRVVVRVKGQLDVPFKQIRRRVDDRALQLGPPAVTAGVPLATGLPALFGSRRVNLFGVRVVHHGNRVPVQSSVDAVDAPGQRNVVFRRIRDLPYVGLTGKIDSEQVRPAGVLNPVLGEGRPRT